MALFNRHNFIFFFGLCSTIVGLSRAGFGASEAPQPVLAHISHYIPETGRQPLVVLDIHGAAAVAEGDVLAVQRPSSAPGSVVGEGPEMNVDTGAVKVLQIHGTSGLAMVVTDGTEVSQRLFPKFPGVMAGDFAVRQEATIESNLVLSPTVTMPYDMIFEDPNSGARTYELSQRGKALVADFVRPLANSRLSRLVIQGFTDSRGPSELNQIESLQRALTIRQFMIVTLGFDSNRLVAFGLGESEPMAGPRVPDSERMNRRIVIKALPDTSSPQ